jgi:hypothetical protein
MEFRQFSIGAAVSVALGLFAQSALSEELSVATFAVTYADMNKERYMGLSDEHRAIIDEVAGLPISLELAKSFDSADERSQKIISETTDKNYKWVVVSDEEHTKMDAAVAAGLEKILADYEDRGIVNVRDIYSALNK